jgi:hypothetical protein
MRQWSDTGAREANMLGMPLDFVGWGYGVPSTGDLLPAQKQLKNPCTKKGHFEHRSPFRMNAERQIDTYKFCRKSKFQRQK